MELMDWAPILGIPATVKILDAYRQLVTDHDLRKFLYTVGAWVVGIGVVFLVSVSSANFPVGNWADIVLVGIGVGSTASVAHDFSTRGVLIVEDEESIEVEQPDPPAGQFADIPGTDAPDG